jgi:hypothetical protein
VAVLDAVNLYRTGIDLAEIQKAFDERRFPGPVDSGQPHATARR